ncbi:MAG: STAS domain-containing protein [Clostridiales bacterium]|nr:STAS domain-containing protein [Clostridiales bacterium]
MIKKIVKGNLTEIVNTSNNKVMLSALKVIKGGSIILKIKGSVKTPSAAALTETIMENIAVTNNLIIDLAEVEYMASSGLRALLAAQKYADDSDDDVNMTVRNPNDEITEVFEMTGFDNILNIEK